MINCPKCNELIGEKLKTCPMCHTEFDEGMMAKIERQMHENMLAQEGEVIRIRNEFQEKQGKFWKWIIALLILTVVDAGMFLTISKRMWIIVGILGILILFGYVGVFVWAVMTKALICPFCERFIWQSAKGNCPHCGERIGD